MGKLAAVVLAAGQGTRMKSSFPKVLHAIAGRPMIEYVLDAVAPLVVGKPVVVVGHGADLVRQRVGDAATFALQEEQLGTGHAVLQAREILQDRADHILVLNGDMPLLTTETLRSLVDAREMRSATITLLTCTLQGLMGFGRILRDEKGSVAGIIEEHEATPEQQSIRELNAGVYCFEAAWLWEI